MGAEVDIKDLSKQVWHGLVHPGHQHGSRLQWLGHLGCKDDERLPKRLLFGELRKKRACHGPKNRWKDQISENSG